MRHFHAVNAIRITVSSCNVAHKSVFNPIAMDFDTPEPVRALLLLSGGLDSQLAVCVLREQGIDVHAIVFKSPFFFIGAAKRAAAQLNLPLHIYDFSKDVISLLDNPPHGFGKCMNPCVDCHALMLRRAGDMLGEFGAKFLATGEVLNERPKSQKREALNIVATDSGHKGLILRPLSARLLPETIPEQKGWVDRSRLLDLEGRGRKRQFALAEKYGLKEYPTPASGCRLTEPNFCKRLHDLREHEGLDGVRSIKLLCYGRHFRLADRLKIVVGRNEHDNAVLEGRAELYDIVLKPHDVVGPTGLLPFTAGEEQIRQAAAICARYSDSRSGEPVRIRVRTARGVRLLEVDAACDDDVQRLMI